MIHVASQSIARRAPRLLLSLAGGLVFGAGLLVSQLTRPDRIVAALSPARLDINPWLTMTVGALVFGVLFRLLLRLSPRLPAPIVAPARGAIDGRLVLGASLFGVGWGLQGFCPGAAAVAAGAGVSGGWLFLLAVTVGFQICRPSSKPG